MRRFLLAGAVLASVLALPSIAAAKAPRTATILLGKSMAGADFKDAASFTASGKAIDGSPYERWGRFQNGQCFELNCVWRGKSSAGIVVVQFAGTATMHMTNMRTSIKGWKTKKGIHPGSTTAALEAAYPGRVMRGRYCDVNDFGAPIRGYAFNHNNGGFTFFQIAGPNSTKVNAIWIGKGAVTESC